jgi:hypothetical protein
MHAGWDGLWRPKNGLEYTTNSLEQVDLKSTGPPCSTGLETPTALLALVPQGPTCVGPLMVLLIHGIHERTFQDFFPKGVVFTRPVYTDPQTGSSASSQMPRIIETRYNFGFSSLPCGENYSTHLVVPFVTFWPYSSIGW